MIIRILLGLGILLIVAVATSIESDIPAEALEAKYGVRPSQFITLPSGARAHYRSQGNPKGEHLLLVHGSNASLHTWEPWIRILGRDFRVTTVDLPGHGLTGPVPNEDYSVKGMLAFLDEFTQAVGLERFHLGGNSFGAALAWRFALAKGDAVEKLILIDGAGIPDAPTPVIFKLFRIPVINQLSVYIGPRWIYENQLRQAIANEDVITKVMIDRYHELALREGQRAANLKRLSQDRDYSDITRLGEVTQPTLILWGDKDEWVPLDQGQKLDAEIPNSTLIVYREVGHIPMEEVPDQSAKDVRRFLLAK